MDSRIASALEAAFPDREVATVQSTGPSWNDGNRTVGVEFADERTVYLKIATDGDGSRIARERAVVDYVAANSGVPVPTVLASDAERRIPYLATAPVPGRSFLEVWAESDVDRRAALARQVGAALADVHALRFEEHGHVVGGGANGLELDAGPWTDVLVDRIGDMRALASDDRFDHHFDEVIAAVEANRELLDDAPAALLHGDPAQPNCFHTDDGVGLLDWEIAYVGDPARDLYRARDQQLRPFRDDAPEQVVNALYDGYRERAGGLPDGFEARRPVYEAVGFLKTSGYLDKYADYLDEPAEELAEWVRDEMERKLAKIA